MFFVKITRAIHFEFHAADLSESLLSQLALNFVNIVEKIVVVQLPGLSSKEYLHKSFTYIVLLLELNECGLILGFLVVINEILESLYH